MINFLYRKYGERERGKMDVWFKITTTCRALDYRLRHDLLEYFSSWRFGWWFRV